MRFSPATYLVKLPIVDKSNTAEPALVRTPETTAENPARPTCHLWLGVTSTFDDLLFCTIAEAPDALHLGRGASFIVESESIVDWMIIHEETAFGGFSLRL